MRTSWMAGMVLLASMSVACAEAPVIESVDETTSEGDSATSTSAASSKRGGDVDDTEDEGSQKLQAEPAADQSAYDAPCEPSWWGCVHAARCTSRAGDNESTVSILYDSETRVVRKLTAAAKRYDGKTESDLAISVKGPTDATYGFVFRSAEIPANGTDVAIPVPTDFRVLAGTSVRFETKFGGQVAGSAIATCFVNF